MSADADESEGGTIRSTATFRGRRLSRLSVRRDVCISPRDGREHDFFVIESADWINIIPLTAADEVVMIEQYRHGSDEVTLEIPGGMVDEGESPQATPPRARCWKRRATPRRRVVSLRQGHDPNPAIQNNWIHTFLARGVGVQHNRPFEGTEHTIVRLVPLADIPRLIADGSITHSLVVVGFHWLSLWEKGLLGKAS